MTADSLQSPSDQGPRLYRDLADRHPLLTPAGDYVEEAAFYRRLFETHCHRPPRTLLDLGSSGGHNAAHLKAALTCTLVDLAPAMLALSRRLNPECDHVQGDFVSETLAPGTETSGSDAGGRALRYLEWRWAPDSRTDTYVTDMAYVLRDESGAVEVLHDRHVMGLFSRSVWMELIAAAGFEPLVVPFEHSSYSNTGHEVFLGLHPVRDEGA